MPKGSFDDNMYGQGDPEADPNDPGQLQANPIVRALMQAQQAQSDPTMKGDLVPPWGAPAANNPLAPAGYTGGLGTGAPTGPAVPAVRPAPVLPSLPQTVPVPNDPNLVPPMTGPSNITLSPGGALRGQVDPTQQNVGPGAAAAGAGNPNAPIQPNVVPMTREPPAQTSAPQGTQTTGATPEQTTEDSQTTPDRGITSYSPTTEPTGQPSQDSDKPGGRTGKAGGNLRGLGETLATLPPFKPPTPQHISTPGPPRPTHIAHQLQSVAGANQPLANALKLMEMRHTLGQALRGR
jgi:hypothetical protein